MRIGSAIVATATNRPHAGRSFARLSAMERFVRAARRSCGSFKRMAAVQGNHNYHHEFPRDFRHGVRYFVSGRWPSCCHGCSRSGAAGVGPDQVVHLGVVLLGTGVQPQALAPQEHTQR